MISKKKHLKNFVTKISEKTFFRMIIEKIVTIKMYQSFVLTHISYFSNRLQKYHHIKY
jgi:hypothetical protein